MRALVDAFLREYLTQADDIVIDTLDVWQEWLPEFDAETINAKYKGVSGGGTLPCSSAMPYRRPTMLFEQERKSCSVSGLKAT